MTRTSGPDDRQTRRTFVKNAATAAAGVAAATGADAAHPPAALADAGSRAQSAADRDEGAVKKEITRIFLFIHPPSTLSVHELTKPNPQVEENWRKIVREKGSDEKSFICILQTSKPDKGLIEAATKHFGDRCIIDPNDNSDATKVLLSRDLDRTFQGRGFHGEWNHYEVWSSNNARRWTEGFKRRLAEKGYAIDPKTVAMEAFGNWTGCHHKYTNFMAAYLGLTKPATIHAETSLSTLKGLPQKPAEHLECIPMDRHVLLLLFRREDGCPMAQYWDGLRPVWKPPHTATVTGYKRRVELFTFTSNAVIPVNGAAKRLRHGFVADVGDGTRPAYTTIVGTGRKDADVKEFRDALAGAKIEPHDDRFDVCWSVQV